MIVLISKYLRSAGTRFGYLSLLTLTLLIALPLAAASVSEAGQGKKFSAKLGGPVKVMTQNLYIGANIFAPFFVPPEDFNEAALETLDKILASDFPSRAQAFADLVARNKPDLIGLQEVYTITSNFPDLGPDYNFTINYLFILMAALAERNLDYSVAQVGIETDVPIPITLEIPPPVGPIEGFVQVTDSDVILARGGVETTNPEAEQYGAFVPFGPLNIYRGYVAIDATVKGKTYRFVNTHLEVEDFVDPSTYMKVQVYQAMELVDYLAAEDLPIILVGDFNSRPDDHTSAYPEIMSAGYLDVWVEKKNRPWDPGFTCCQDEELMNPFSMLDERIDHIFVYNESGFFPFSTLGPVKALTIGDRWRDKTPSGLWISDHAGVFAHMLIPTPRH
jgi:endonuclease/exonuclease/phosphatase family metal-dependent hydrolase